MASLFDILIRCEPRSHGVDGFYFCENGEIENGLLMNALARAFYTASIFTHKQPIAVPEAELNNDKVSLLMQLKQSIPFTKFHRVC